LIYTAELSESSPYIYEHRIVDVTSAKRSEKSGLRFIDLSYFIFGPYFIPEYLHRQKMLS
jgi:hypothetical protein